MLNARFALHEPQMTTSMTHAEAVTWIADLFHVEASALKPETTRNEIMEWDSLGALTLMAALDSDFGIMLTDDDVRTLNTVSDILDILRRSGKLD